jgi:hypothetical protein
VPLLADEIAGTFVGYDAVPAKLVVAAGAAFAVMDGRKLVFSEERQEIYELNDMAAYIWCRMDEGATPATVAAELIEAGISPEAAEAYVRDMLVDWRGLGLLAPAPPAVAAPPPDPVPDPRQQPIRVAGISIRIHYPTDSLAALAAPTFRHLETGDSDAAGGPPADVSLTVQADGDRFRLLAGDHDVGLYALNEIVPALKAQLTADVLAHGAYSLAIHAAALVRDGRMLLVCGEPGAGKTTLTLALVHAGFGYGGDDIALLMPQGQVAGVPFAASVKAGAWPLLSRFRPDLQDLPIFRRTDGQDVRYLPPDAPATDPLLLGWVVLLRRQPGGPAQLTHLDRIDAMRAVLVEATAPGQRLSASAFGLLAHAMAGAECHALTYARLDDAVSELRRACV